MTTALPLTGHLYLTISPDQVTHRLTDDHYSHFDLGPLRVAVRAGDLTQVRAARELAAAIAARAGFWETDLAAIEARLQMEEDAHTADAPAPSQAPTPAPEPTLAEQIAAPDPKLDAAVERVAELADAQRDPEEEGDL